MPGPDLLWDVVEEHLDEASFLGTQWERALASPALTPRDVVRGPEERLLAHVDALVVAGVPAVERVLAPALAGDDADPVFAAALALLDGADAGAPARVLARLDEDVPAEVARAVTRALALCHRRGIEAALLEAARGGEPTWVAAALSALAARRVPVPDVAVFLASRDPAVLAPALAVSRAGGAVPTVTVERALASERRAVRDAAIEAGLVRGLPSARAMCQRLVRERRPDAVLPLLALAMVGDEADLGAVIAAVDDEALRPAALVALGYSGRVAAVEACLPWLPDVAVAKLAGEAVSAITGLALEGPLAKSEEEPEALPPLDEDDLDADLVPGPEAALPLPAPEEVERWWAGARDRLDPATRYLAGKPWSREALVTGLREGPMRRRRALALELAIRTRGEVDVETRGWVRGQVRAPSRAAGVELHGPGSAVPRG